MTRFLALFLYLSAVALVVGYVLVSPTLAIGLTGSQPIGHFVAAANLALVITWGLLTGGIRIEFSFRSADKACAAAAELAPGAVVELPAGKAASHG